MSSEVVHDEALPQAGAAETLAAEIAGQAADMAMAQRDIGERAVRYTVINGQVVTDTEVEMLRAEDPTDREVPGVR